MMEPTNFDKGRRLAPINFAAVKATVGIHDVLHLLNWQAVRRRGDELRGPCPVHGSSSPASTIFAANIVRNIWKCHKCDAGGNQLDLAAHYFGLPPDQSVRIAVALCREYGIEIPRIE